MSSIDVKVYNDSDFNNIVLVFARNYPVPITQETLKMAWRIMLIPSKGNTQFTFPMSNKIGAFCYIDDGSRVSAGPVEAELGTTWIASAIGRGTDISLTQNVTAAPVSGSGYVIHNQKPDESLGRILTIALYKGDGHQRPFNSKQCRVGNYVTMIGTARKLYFGVMKPSLSLEHYRINERDDELPTAEVSDSKNIALVPDTEFTPLTEIEFNEEDSDSVMEVKLTENDRNGQFCFTHKAVSHP